MVKRSEIVNLGGLWLEGHGLSEVSETLGHFDHAGTPTKRTKTSTRPPSIACPVKLTEPPASVKNTQ